MTAQPELDFRAPADAASEADVDRLIGLLSGKGWMTGRTLTMHLGWTERRLRNAASLSDGLVLSWPGSQGYRLTQEAPGFERVHGIKALTAQAAEMIRRANAIQGVASGEIL